MRGGIRHAAVPEMCPFSKSVDGVAIALLYENGRPARHFPFHVSLLRADGGDHPRAAGVRPPGTYGFRKKRSASILLPNSFSGYTPLCPP
jgi:hypothetical protein